MFRDRGTKLRIRPKLYSPSANSKTGVLGCDMCESGYETERTLTVCRCGYSWKKRICELDCHSSLPSSILCVCQSVSRKRFNTSVHRKHSV